MKLPLPVAALPETLVILVIEMRLVFHLQLSPGSVPLRRRHIRILIHNVLEFVHHTAVGDKSRRILQMHVNIVLLPVPKEQIHPAFRKEFHRHGVDFRRLHGDVRMLPDGILSADEALEGVAAFMGDDVHIPAGAVKVGEDKGGFVVGQIRHIASGPLCLAAKHVKELILHHEVKEFPGLV